MQLFDLSKPVDHLGNYYEVSATLYEASADGSTYRLRKIEGREALREAPSRPPAAGQSTISGQSTVTRTLNAEIGAEASAQASAIITLHVQASLVAATMTAHAYIGAGATVSGGSIPSVRTFALSRIRL